MAKLNKLKKAIRNALRKHKLGEARYICEENNKIDGRFKCEVHVTAVAHVGSGLSFKKQDSKRFAAKDFYNYLVSVGLIDPKEESADSMPTIPGKGGWTMKNCIDALNGFSLQFLKIRKFYKTMIKISTTIKDSAKKIKIYDAEASINLPNQDKVICGQSRASSPKKARTLCALCIVHQLFDLGFLPPSKASKEVKKQLSKTLSSSLNRLSSTRTSSKQDIKHPPDPAADHFDDERQQLPGPSSPSTSKRVHFDDERQHLPGSSNANTSKRMNVMLQRQPSPSRFRAESDEGDEEDGGRAGVRVGGSSPFNFTAEQLTQMAGYGPLAREPWTTSAWAADFLASFPPQKQYEGIQHGQKRGLTKNGRHKFNRGRGMAARGRSLAVRGRGLAVRGRSLAVRSRGLAAHANEYARDYREYNGFGNWKVVSG